MELDCTQKKHICVENNLMELDGTQKHICIETNLMELDEDDTTLCPNLVNLNLRLSFDQYKNTRSYLNDHLIPSLVHLSL